MSSDSKATLELRIIGTDKAISEVGKFEQSTTRSMTRAEKSVASGLMGMAAQYLSLAVAVQKSMKALSTGVEFNKFVENTTMSFTVMMKSAEAAKDQMKKLYDFAVVSPLTFQETAKAAKQLMAYGFSAKELVPTMDMLGTVAISTGHSLGDISYVYGTLKSQGRAYSRDLLQFGMRGIPIYEELAKVLDVNVNVIQKMASEGKIGFKEVEKAFVNMTTNGGRFAGTLEGYMDTLTGKTAMLSDIWEKVAGTMAKGITDNLKILVEDVTKTIENEGMTYYFQELSQDIGVIASMLRGMITALIKALPVITVFVKIWLAFIATSLIFKGIAFLLKGLPIILLNAAVGATTLSAATASAATGMAALATSAGWFVTAMIGMAPIIGILAGVTAGIVMVSRRMQELARDKKMIADKEYFEQEIVKEARGKGSASASGLSGISMKGLTDKQQVEMVGIWAKKYGQAADEIARILYFSELINASSAEQLGFSISNYIAQQRVTDGMAKTEALLSGRNFISTLEAVGLSIASWDTYVDNTQKGMLALGKAVPQNISKIVEPNLDWKKENILDILPSMDVIGEMIKAGAGQVYIDSETKAILEKRSELLQGYFMRLIQRDLDNPKDQNPELKAWLAQQITLTENALGGLKDKIEQLKKSWTAQEWATKVTESKIDDIELSAEKSLYAAQEEYKERLDIMHKLRAQNIISETSFNNFKITNAKEIAQIELDIQKDMTDQIIEYKRSKDIENFNKMKSGDPEYWKDMQAAAGRGDKGAAVISTLEGTEAGSMMAGGDPITVAIMALAEFALSIENVSKILNPFKTIFEAMRPVIEPLVNNVLQPLVNFLEMLGEVVGQLLTPFLGLSKLLTTFSYIFVTYVIWPLQMLGNAFAWFYNSIIVPVANVFVKAVNKVIRWINRLTGSNIRLLDQLEKTTDALRGMQDIATGMKDSLDKTITYLANAINSRIDDQIGSMQDLYDVGAITGTDYAAEVSRLNEGRIETEATMISLADQTLAELGSTGAIATRLGELLNVQQFLLNNPGLTAEQIVSTLKGANILTPKELMAEHFKSVVDAINSLKGAATGTAIGGVLENPNAGRIAELQKQGADAVQKQKRFESTGLSGLAWMQQALAAILRTRISELGGVPSFAVGTAQIPKDMIANLHKDEGVIPAPFMKSIMAGDISLSGGKNKGEPNINVTVHVQGSVQAENELASTIANRIYTQRSRGILTV